MYGYSLHKALRQTRTVQRQFHVTVPAYQAKVDKRPLQEAHLKGAGTPNRTAAPTNGSSTNTALLGIAALTVAGGGAYYYYTTNMTHQTQTHPMVKEVSVTPQKETETAGEEAEPNRVTEIEFPANMKNTATTADAASTTTVTEHPHDGHKVLMDPTQNEDDHAKNKNEQTLESERALTALQTSVTEAAMEALLANHPTMWTATSANNATGGDLDALSEGQLKGRVVQLATELRDRTKWEALRLKEFLAMKEQEVSNEYTKLMQKQRMEFESLLAQRLREQEHALTAQLDAALREKDAKIQALLVASLQTQKQEFEEDKATFEKVTQAELQESLESKYAKQMEELKTQTAQDLQSKVEALQELSAKVAELQAALANSQSHQQGSAQAHRLSAAALNLSERLATDQPAGDEIAALAEVAGPDGGVIATAVATIPPEVHAEGVPTLAQLQTWFDDIYEKGRQAALVPAGRPGLEGQIAGLLLASLKFAPQAKDDAEDDDTPNDSEILLSKARRMVQKGDLTAAVGIIERLPSGQATLTLADWKASALNRVLVDKAVKVIKMECALLNEALAN